MLQTEYGATVPHKAHMKIAVLTPNFYFTILMRMLSNFLSHKRLKTPKLKYWFYHILF